MSTPPEPQVPPGVALLEAVNELRAAETLMSNRARARMHLRAPDYQALQYIAAHDDAAEPARVKDLVPVLGITDAAATIIADRLEKRGLITRTQDPIDRRSRFLAPTDAARAELADVFGLFPREVRDVLNDVDQNDIATIRDLADRVRELLDRTAV
ncbi:MarR family winged helix-turn-helix transcriptional regulator [Curtobacterium sp. ME12]|uniref:MarR family winged helix-turn-helix transcriptional regulator n=1 Tax=Curtobacterium sp. ME12 TaxID=2744253 RepID=UPI0015F4C0E4|nr:MarR family transcriptional regulator [Curtobacterium sp. ME12]